MKGPFRMFAKWARLGLPALFPICLSLPADAAVLSNNWKDELSVSTFVDSRTGDFFVGSKGWKIEPGADNYTSETYERPTSQDFNTAGGVPHFKKYHEALDIVSGKFAIDVVNGLAYFSIDLFGRDEVTFSGNSRSFDEVDFKHFYRVRIANNGDFANGYLLGVKDPSGNSLNSDFAGPNSFKTTQLWDDGGGPVTGTGLTTTDEGTSGYDEKTSEGASNKIRARIVGDSVELAIDYAHFGIDSSQFSNIIFEATQGLTDVQNYFWNDEYSFNEAGSPYSTTNYVENIYELDTLMAAVAPQNPVPEPSSLVLWSALGLMGLAGSRRRKREAGPGG